MQNWCRIRVIPVHKIDINMTWLHYFKTSKREKKLPQFSLTYVIADFNRNAIVHSIDHISQIPFWNVKISEQVIFSNVVHNTGVFDEFFQPIGREHFWWTFRYHGTMYNQPSRQRFYVDMKYNWSVFFYKLTVYKTENCSIIVLINA